MVKTIVALVAIWMLLVPYSGQLDDRWTICGKAFAQGSSEEEWYGALTLTSSQVITIELQHDQRECRLAAVISLHFGDSEHVFTQALPVLQRYQMPATAFITIGRIGKPDYLELRQIRELSEHNWEIGSHTVTHTPLVELSPDQVRYELQQSKHALESEGFRVSGFLSPFGLYNEPIIAEIQRLYTYHRADAWGLNELPLFSDHLGSRWELFYIQVKRDTPPQEVMAMIKQVSLHGRWLILDFHDISEDDPRVYYPSKALEEIVRFIRVDLKLCTWEELQRGACPIQP